MRFGATPTRKCRTELIELIELLELMNLDELLELVELAHLLEAPSPQHAKFNSINEFN